MTMQNSFITTATKIRISFRNWIYSESTWVYNPE